MPVPALPCSPPQHHLHRQDIKGSEGWRQAAFTVVIPALSSRGVKGAPGKPDPTGDTWGPSQPSPGATPMPAHLSPGPPLAPLDSRAAHQGPATLDHHDLEGGASGRCQLSSSGCHGTLVLLQAKAKPPESTWQAATAAPKGTVEAAAAQSWGGSPSDNPGC